MKILAVFVSTLLFIVVASSTAPPLEDGTSHFYPDIYNTDVVFAVHAINKRMTGWLGASMGYSGVRTALRVVSATVKVSTGLIYRFQIEVTQGKKNNEICEVTVESKPWLAEGENRRFHNVRCYILKRSQTTTAYWSTQSSSTMSTTTSSSSSLSINDTNTTTTTTSPSTEDSTTITTTTTTTTAAAAADTTTNVSSLYIIEDLLSADARQALVFLTDEFNAPRSIFYRFMPYDVEVFKYTDSTLKDNPQFIYNFALRLALSKCTKIDPNAIGKISLRDCPPQRPRVVASADGPKCKFQVVWRPNKDPKPYTLNTYVCQTN